MPSPLPGMNPWLEQDDVWHDFHESFVPAIRRALVSQLPANKRRSDDRAQYLRKRQQLLRSDAHLIEIDLLRGGERLPLDDLADCDYCVAVSRAEDRPRVGIWPIRLRDPLPVIPVPLRAPDADAWLDLTQILDGVYDEARYERYIYSGKPQPRLHPDDEAWARSCLPQ